MAILIEIDSRTHAIAGFMLMTGTFTDDGSRGGAIELPGVSKIFAAGALGTNASAVALHQVGAPLHVLALQVDASDTGTWWALVTRG